MRIKVDAAVECTKCGQDVLATMVLRLRFSGMGIDFPAAIEEGATAFEGMRDGAELWCPVCVAAVQIATGNELEGIARRVLGKAVYAGEGTDQDVRGRLLRQMRVTS